MQLLTNEITIFPSQDSSKTLVVLEYTFHGELGLWIGFDLNNSLTFSNKLCLKKAISLIWVLTNKIAKFFQSSYIEMISLLKFNYIVMLAHQLVGF